jgi:hypothetical protein
MGGHSMFFKRLSVALAIVLASTNPITAEPRRKLVVALDGSGQFTSIVAAVDSVKDTSASNPVDVVIKPATYTETIATRDWVNLIGEDRDRCLIKYSVDVSQAKDAHKFHVIWATSNTSIKNLTLVGGIVKYCIHSDGGRDYILTVENCVLCRDPNAYPANIPQGARYHAAFGIGLRSRQHIIMKDCLVEAGLPIYFHNWNDQAGSCSMTLDKCRLEARSDYALQLVALGSNHRDFVVIHDSVLKSPKKSVGYTNAKLAGPAGGLQWHGASEIELVGSGNQIDAVELVTMKDDTGKRLSGVELCKRSLMHGERMCRPADKCP